MVDWKRETYRHVSEMGVCKPFWKMNLRRESAAEETATPNVLFQRRDRGREFRWVLCKDYRMNSIH